MNKFQSTVALYRQHLDTCDWKTPGVVDCSRFVMQEAAETDSALMKAGYQNTDHARNHPVSSGDAMKQVEEEIGQAYVMLCTLANLLSIDLDKTGKRFLEKMYMKHTKPAGCTLKTCVKCDCWDSENEFCELGEISPEDQTKIDNFLES